MAVFREVSTGSSESSLQGTGRPAAFNGQGPRPGAAANLRPAKVPMWTTANGKGLTLRKSAGSITCHCVVWYRSIPLLP